MNTYTCTLHSATFMNYRTAYCIEYVCLLEDIIILKSEPACECNSNLIPLTSQHFFSYIPIFQIDLRFEHLYESSSINKHVHVETANWKMNKFYLAFSIYLHINNSARMCECLMFVYTYDRYKIHIDDRRLLILFTK